MTTIWCGNDIKQKCKNIKEKWLNDKKPINEYNFPDDVWYHIKEYLGIGNYVYYILEKLSTKQLRNIIDCTFRCELPTYTLECNRSLISIFKKELWKKEHSDKLRHIIVKRTKQTIKELGVNLSSEMCVSTYAGANISCMFLGIENNMNDKYPTNPRIIATPRRFPK
jgi:hypothetical protein